ncbi:MAG: ParA family protein [Sphingobacterium sp.]
MLIIFANQKGGTGKSTLALLYAAYLNTYYKSRVCVLDMDGQHSLSQKAQKDGPVQDTLSYHLLPADLQDLAVARENLKEGEYDYVLVDLSSGRPNQELIAVYDTADAVVCPYHADELTLNGTLVFLKVFTNINDRAALFFVPNKVRRNANEHTQKAIKSMLEKYGVVSSPLPDRPDFQRLNTQVGSVKAMELVRAAFDEIHQGCLQHLHQISPK